MSPITVKKAVLTITGCAAFSVAVGLGVGYSIGSYAPDFIRALFPLTKQSADTIEIGVGLGTVCGGLIGVAIGVLIVAVIAWLGSKTPQAIDK